MKKTILFLSVMMTMALQSQEVPSWFCDEAPFMIKDLSEEIKKGTHPVDVEYSMIEMLAGAREAQIKSCSLEGQELMKACMEIVIESFIQLDKIKKNPIEGYDPKFISKRQNDIIVLIKNNCISI